MMPREVNRDSKMMVVRVEYQWRPFHCAYCRVFGHGEALCPKQPKVELQDTRGRKVLIVGGENDGISNSASEGQREAGG
ncbi:hypothetical protein Patl1_04680 [Pistacia atlantica]|uniref:Uncharacterized protein n=1 Tax=Pistacia atlantica TaxID=434234 RepID=A0ACC1BS47_9ROSI|nr:hypothetical protein Patl1_04680 [Pistacia atlantica]